MTEQDKQDGQKTVVAFIAGLLIGGLLVWVFDSNGEPVTDQDTQEPVTEEPVTNEQPTTNDSTDNTTNQNTNEEPEAPTMQTGAGRIDVSDQPAGTVVAISGAVYPNDEGWMGVRDFDNGQLTGLLGVARFSKEQGLIPTQIELLRATKPGKQYAVVFYSESGDRKFNLANDVQLEDVVATFTAQ